jgi:hypothetical protein
MNKVVEVVEFRTKLQQNSQWFFPVMSSSCVGCYFRRI